MAMSSKTDVQASTSVWQTWAWLGFVVSLNILSYFLLTNSGKLALNDDSDPENTSILALEWMQQAMDIFFMSLSRSQLILNELCQF